MSEDQGGGSTGKIVVALVVLMVLGCGGCSCLGVAAAVVPQLLVQFSM